MIRWVCRMRRDQSEIYVEGRGWPRDVRTTKEVEVERGWTQGSRIYTFMLDRMDGWMDRWMRAVCKNARLCWLVGLWLGSTKNKMTLL